MKYFSGYTIVKATDTPEAGGDNDGNKKNKKDGKKKKKNKNKDGGPEAVTEKTRSESTLPYCNLEFTAVTTINGELYCFKVILFTSLSLFIIIQNTSFHS